MSTNSASNGVDSKQQQNKKDKANKKGPSALDPAVIEEKRRARAEKKEREAREKADKEAAAAASGTSLPTLDEHGNPLFAPRQWGKVDGVQEEASQGSQRLKVLSWNMLAQGLVRRKLFPGSDALRWKDREDGLAAELVGHGWDVGCFQEVDRIECHAETLHRAGYSHVYAKGYAAKQHGLMLAWRTREKPQAANASDLAFEPEPVATETLYYDDAEVTPGRTASSRITRNIALFAAVPFKSKADSGVILATTHLFWHPMHAYERVRQAGLLVRALDAFRSRKDAPWTRWAVVLAGDFNDQPHSASYGLLTGRGLDEHGCDEIARSSVVHESVDRRSKQQNEAGVPKAQATASEKSAAKGPPQTADNRDGHIDGVAEDDEEEEEEEGGADDQMLKNCRSAKPSDELLSLDEFKQLFDLSQPLPSPQNPPASASGAKPNSSLLSAYATAYHRLFDPSEHLNTFSHPTRGRERWDDESWHEGQPNVHRHLAGTPAGNEPMWTLFSSLFGLTLDFIFLLPLTRGAANPYPRVTKLLRTHPTDVLKVGLPKKNVCVSDHVAIGAEIEVEV
ncbi:unnamed protein product [Jaminaea pallidilutea]